MPEQVATVALYVCAGFGFPVIITVLALFGEILRRLKRIEELVR
jgi:hypothetical protein